MKTKLLNTRRHQPRQGKYTIKIPRCKSMIKIINPIPIGHRNRMNPIRGNKTKREGMLNRQAFSPGSNKVDLNSHFLSLSSCW